MKTLNFSLTESLLQISSSLFTITNLQPSSFTDTIDDVFYFMYNNFNNMLEAIILSGELYVEEELDRTSSSGKDNKSSK